MGASAPKLPTAIHPQPEAGAPTSGCGILAFSRKTPMQTFLDSVPLAKENMLNQTVKTASEVA